MIKKRIDQLLVEKQLVETRTKAKAMIMAGQIFVDEKQINKSGAMFKDRCNNQVLKIFNQNGFQEVLIKYYMP